MDPFDNNGSMTVDDKTFTIDNMNRVMSQTLLTSSSKAGWYDKFNRYGWINPFDRDEVSREFLFFTKPDLYIFESEGVLQEDLRSIPFFVDAARRYPRALAQLQVSCRDNGVYNPFNRILTNAATGRMDLPPISAETLQSTANLYGFTIDYRSHSLKSDGSYDFAISFTDTAYLEIYTMIKAYDLYMRLLRTGGINLRKNDHFKGLVINHIVPEQFSVYKFLIGSDGETILFPAKATGVFFVDVPRSEFSDPGKDGFNYSVTFHANAIEDDNPLIYSEFNYTTPAAQADYLNVVDYGGVNNEWASYPIITAAIDSSDKRAARRGRKTDYRLKWTNTGSGGVYRTSSNVITPDSYTSSSMATSPVRSSLSSRQTTNNGLYIYDAGDGTLRVRSGNTRLYV